MPVHHNNLIDDPLAFDRQESFTGGQVSYPRGNLLTASQATVLWDMVNERNGALGNRRGFHALGNIRAQIGAAAPQGLWWYDTTADQLLLAVAGGKMYSLDGPGAVWELVTSTACPNTSALASGAQVGANFYLACSGAPASKKGWSTNDLLTHTAGTNLTDGPARLDGLISSRFRLFGQNADIIDEVYCSTFLPEKASPFTQTGQPILPFRVGEGDGDPLIALVPWRGLFGLVGLKRGSVSIIDTTPAGNNTTAATLTADFQMQVLSGSVGCVARHSAARTGTDVFFLADDGVRSVTRTAQDADGELTEALSLPVHDYIERINPAAVHKACAITWRGRYFLAKTGAGSVFTGLQPIAWEIAAWRDEAPRLCMFDARGQVLEWRDWLLPASATAGDYQDVVIGFARRIPWRARTRALAWNEPICPKQLDHVEFEFDRSNALVDVDLILDEGNPQRLASKMPTGFGELIMPPDDSPLVWDDWVPQRSKGMFFVLDCILGQAGVLRERRSLTHYGATRELLVEVREAAGMTYAEESGSVTLRMRTIASGAYLETMEKDE